MGAPRRRRQQEQEEEEQETQTYSEEVILILIILNDINSGRWYEQQTAFSNVQCSQDSQTPTGEKT
jgi:hypothetical protein